jgi:uncharacterized protein
VSARNPLVEIMQRPAQAGGKGDKEMQKQTGLVVIENFGSCNLRCMYCFPEHMWEREGHKGVITDENFRGIVEKTLSTTSAETVNVRFAGGEPLLPGLAWFEKACAMAREIGERHGKRVSFSLQTNATMVTPELARFLAENAVHVGVSLDGPPELNDAMRGDTDRVLAGFRLLTEAYGRQPGIIVTTTNCNAGHMPEVFDYLESLGVTGFRANQMGATASWNTHAAPRAEEWAAARRDILTQNAARGGRIMEFNVVQGVRKFVRSVLEGSSPFTATGSTCCDIRCAAGRGLMYFDQKGNGYGCPRANVTPEARIGNFMDADFDERWDEAIIRLDEAMIAPDECRACPAQFVCDYGCHAFNVAQGNFFEVNCDGTKEYFEWFRDHLEDVARVFYYATWRDRVEADGNREALRDGLDAPAPLVTALAEKLRTRLAERLARPEIKPALIDKRYGWREDLVPVETLNRPRVGTPIGTAKLATLGGD